MRLLIDNARVWGGTGAGASSGKVLLEDDRIAAVALQADRSTPEEWRTSSGGASQRTRVPPNRAILPTCCQSTEIRSRTSACCRTGRAWPSS